jgi:hypothetical protein
MDVQQTTEPTGVLPHRLDEFRLTFGASHGIAQWDGWEMSPWWRGRIVTVVAGGRLTNLVARVEGDHPAGLAHLEPIAIVLDLVAPALALGQAIAKGRFARRD